MAEAGDDVDRARTGAISARPFSIRTAGLADPTSAIAAETALGNGARLAMGGCTCGAGRWRPHRPESASTSSGEYSSTQLATRAGRRQAQDQPAAAPSHI